MEFRGRRFRNAAHNLFYRGDLAVSVEVRLVLDSVMEIGEGTSGQLVVYGEVRLGHFQRELMSALRLDVTTAYCISEYTWSYVL